METVVTTVYGDLRGSKHGAHEDFLGIPFAAPPNAERRFLPPAHPARPGPASAMPSSTGSRRPRALTQSPAWPPAATATKTVSI